MEYELRCEGVVVGVDFEACMRHFHGAAAACEPAPAVLAFDTKLHRLCSWLLSERHTAWLHRLGVDDPNLRQRYWDVVVVTLVRRGAS